MTRITAVLAIAIFFGSMFGGCKISVEKACKKVIEARNETRDKAKKWDGDKVTKKIEKCVKRMKERKEKKPKAVACVLKCADDNSKWKEMRNCFKDKKCSKADK